MVIQNAAEHLNWSRKERLPKNNYGQDLFPEDITVCLTGM